MNIHESFRAQVERTPDAVALAAGPQRLSYTELDQRASRLARHLIGLGVTAESPVAIAMERGPDLVVATLAVLKAGGCYLPLHGSHPLARKQWIVQQAGVRLLLADEASHGRGVPGTEQTVLTGAWPGAEPTGPAAVTDPGVVADPDQLAYVMYTSGSTGEPKSVGVTHRNVLGLAGDGMWSTGRHERVLMVAPHAFSVSTYELWVPLLRGGTIVLAPEGNLDVATIGRLIAAEEISCVHLTAGLFRVMAEAAPEAFAGVREVLTGGDVVAPGAVQRVLDACPGTAVQAMYGASEVSLFAFRAPMTAPGGPRDRVPVGRPLDGIRHYILDERLAHVPDEVTGELYIAGDRLARGYLGRPDLTAESFVMDPFGGPGERMYRTGDLVRRRADGRLDFAGRAGDQVKILGFRVEPAEVEAALSRYPGLAHVAVVTREMSPGDKRLVGYVVPGPGDFDMAALREYAQQTLPDYMVPNAFVALDTLPLTPNGKLDRRSLPEPDFQHADQYRAPVTPTEKAACELFADVLGVDRVGMNDNFFDLGGQSLLALRLVSRIRSELGVELPVRVLFDEATVAGLVKQIDQAER
jgi:amino acid adenylation domain-containing protein